MKDNIRIALGADHRGSSLRNELTEWLVNFYENVKQFGPRSSSESYDYPLVAQEVAEEVVQGYSEFGILICGSGIGVSIAANRIKSIRACVGYSEKIVQIARKHNDANILCFGSDWINFDNAKKITEVFLSTKFLNAARHIRRLKQLDNL